MQTQLYDGTGRPVTLTRELGRGGEGSVWEIGQSPTSVAKIYHEPAEWEKVEKLKIMARLATPAILRVAAWPTGTVHKSPNGPLVGFLQPKVSSHVEIHQLYGPAQRKQQFPRADWSFLVHVAMNCAAAFETVHEGGHIIGDVNQSGVLVSHAGTVHLIDCDSFQIHNGPQLFPCEVGVPQYTPPELQGQNFQFVERTWQHDCFGLAILIFHLLFMGRHPFAGRFEGSDDMPIEKAISEGRFAFGRMAPFYQMTPPPHSLELSSLPEPVEEMFERAFALPDGKAARPNAAEWRVALAGVKRSLKPCMIDKGHFYPARLASCPWCAIVRAGGPNFFISVQLSLEGGRVDLPPMDVVGLWHRIETIASPAWQRPTYPPSPQPPEPLPLAENLLDTALFLRAVRVITILSILCAIIGFFTMPLLGWIGVGLTAVFGAWWAILLNMPDFRHERMLRLEEAKLNRLHFKREQAAWDETCNAAKKRFDETREGLRQVRDEALGIRAQFEAEKRELEKTAREAQLHDFLAAHPIPRNNPALVDVGRFATLLSYGVETAADVNEPRLKTVPGLPGDVSARLAAWRDGIEKTFVFDPKQALTPSRLQALVLKFRQMQQTCEARLAGGAEELILIRDTADRELTLTKERIQRLAGEVRQADADAAVL